MKDRVLIVGGAGYIGGAAVDFLLRQHCELMVYDVLMYERDYRKKVPFVFGDILDTDRLSGVIADFEPSAVLWLGAIVGDGACQVNPEATLHINELAVKWLAEHYHGRIVFTSTCSIYGKADGLLTEDSPTNPLSVYAVTKLAAERHLQGKNAVVFRLGTLHGLSDQFSRIRLDLVANLLSLKAMRGEPLTVFGGEQWRPILHVRDAARAIGQAVLVCEVPNNICPGVYNIAQENIRIRDLADTIAEVAPVTPRPVVHYSEISFEDARNYRVDNSKYSRQPGAVPFRISLRESVLEMMELIREGRIKDPFAKVYSNARFLEDFRFDALQRL
jgi:nucleoside-diphosphate-sugar epimerase